MSVHHDFLSRIPALTGQSRFFILISEMREPKDAMKVSAACMSGRKVLNAFIGGVASASLRDGLLRRVQHRRVCVPGKHGSVAGAAFTT